MVNKSSDTAAKVLIDLAALTHYLNARHLNGER